MLDTQSARPLYEQIKDYILINIQNGTFAPDTRIPSERTLADQFSVNRLTVKKAIGELTQSGNLYVQIGKGTYIRRQKVDQQLDMLTSFTEEMIQRGRRAVSRVLEATMIEAALDEARALRVPPGTPLVLLARLRMADEQPMAIERCKIVAAYCPHLLEGHDFSRESLYEVMQHEHGLKLLYAEQTIEARLATPDEARLLQVAEHSAILHMKRVTYLEDDRPLEYVLSAYCGSRYQFQARLSHV